ncbi:glycosyltransferase family 4 protein [Halobellus litoreus]|uniref:Glycosyltransferase family 4 protein n=1 Tax=Halobellus litoreus TaxID=755310 RepID=A0ABD6DUB5_9EURY|nr:glycosyltransferase family 4 protein [Halobellus litoreus]
MHIGMILRSTFPPDIRVRREAKFLVNHGHKLTLFCTDEPNRTSTETIDGINVIRVPTPQSPLAEIGELTYHASFVAPHWCQLVRKYISEFDVLHIHDLPMTRTGLLTARNIDVPVVVDFHEIYPDSVAAWRQSDTWLQRIRPYRLFKPVWRLHRYERRCVENVDALLHESPEQQSYYREHNRISDIDTSVVRNVPDLDRLNDIVIDERTRDEFVVSYVGGFSPQRGLMTVVEAFSELLEIVTDAALLMVGDGSDTYVSQLKNRCADLGISDNVEFTGWVEFDQVFSYLNESDVSLCPWIGDNIDSECTLPNKLFQSMYMGVPVIVSDLKSMRTVVEETESGVVVDSESVSELANALVELYRDPERCRELGENGRQAVEDKYNFQHEGEQLVSLYERIQ